MQAVVINAYGNADRLLLTDIERPEPSANQILVRVHAASINPVDWKVRQGDVRLLTGNAFPRVLGVDFAGVIEKVGDHANKNLNDGYATGDAVFGMANPLNSRYGSYAQYALTTADAIAKKPDQLSFLEAAAIPVAGLTAIKSLCSLIALQPGQSLLINGASGGVGSFAVQIANSLGATVHATCSQPNLDFVKSLGAHFAYDYRQQSIPGLPHRFEGILDASAKLAFSQIKHLLKSGGTYVSTVPTLENVFATLITKVLSNKRARLVLASGSADTPGELATLASMVLSGKLETIITRTISLADLVAVHRLAEKGHNVGKIVVAID